MFPTFSVTTASVFSALDRKNQPGPVRTAKSYELELYLADGEVAYFGSDAYPIRKGTMLFAKPGECRHTVGNFCCRYVHFHCRYRDFAAAYLDTLPTSAALGGSFRCEALMEKLSELFWEKSRTVELRTESILLELIAEFTESAVAPNASQARYRIYRAQIDDTLDYMKNHYQEPLSSLLLSERIHLSVNFFQTVFRELVGTPPAQYLRQLRIESACQMLANTELPLSEVAELNGFSRSSYLTSAFKREQGMTPSAYRKKNKVDL